MSKLHGLIGKMLKGGFIRKLKRSGSKKAKAVKARIKTKPKTKK